MGNTSALGQGIPFLDEMGSPVSWKEIFDAVGQSIMIMDTDHRILAVNNSTLEITGMDHGELIGRRCHEILHRSNEAPKQCPLNRLLSSGKFEREEMEVEALGRFFLVSCSPTFDHQGKIKNIIHIASDVTEKKRLELKTQQKVDEIELLMDIIQHDLGNIHHGIKVFLQLAQEMKDKSRDMMIGGALESTSKAERLAQNLKNLSRLKEGDINHEMLDLVSVLEESIRITKLLHPDHKGRIIFDHGQEMFSIKGSSLVKELFINILDNAVKYGFRDESDIIVKLSRSEDGMEVSIIDEGPGVPEELRSTIFDRFERGSEGSTGGTGLGLSISKKIAESLGAEITISDREDNKEGSCFRIIFS